MLSGEQAPLRTAGAGCGTSRSCKANPSDSNRMGRILLRATSPSSPHGEGAGVDPDLREDHASMADALLAPGGLAHCAAALPASGQSRRATAKGLHRVNCLKPSVFILENTQGSAFPTRNPRRGWEPGWICQNLLLVPLGVRIGVARILHAQGWG